MGLGWKAWLSLGVFTLQNGCSALIMRYATTVTGGAAPFSSSVVVVVQEFMIKLPFWLVAGGIEHGGAVALCEVVATDLRERPREWLKLTFPALLFTIQNMLIYVGYANLEAAIGLVTYQAKIPFTAVCSVLLLGKRLSQVQWLSLLVLFCGVLSVQEVPAKLFTAPDGTNVGTGVGRALQEQAVPPLMTLAYGSTKHNVSEHAAKTHLKQHAAKMLKSSEHGSSEHGSSEHVGSGRISSGYGSSRHGSSGRGSSEHGSGGHGSSEHGSSGHGSSGHGSSGHEHRVHHHPPPSAEPPQGAWPHAPSEAPAGGAGQNPTLGLIAFIVAALCTSFGSVYFERMLKHGSGQGSKAQPSLWLRNAQLASYSSLIAFTYLLVQPGGLSPPGGLFAGFGAFAWLSAFWQALGGIIVAFTIKYADNILRGFAQALAIIVGSLGSCFLFGFVLEPTFLLGATLVIAAVFMYGAKAQRPLELCCPLASAAEESAALSPPPST